MLGHGWPSPGGHSGLEGPMGSGGVSGFQGQAGSGTRKSIWPLDLGGKLSQRIRESRELGGKAS